MTPRIEHLTEKKLVGKRLTMSFANNRIGELWQNFMPQRKSITSNVSNALISMPVYKPTHFEEFNPTHEFEKWATVEETTFENLPPEMEAFVLPGGLYAVFDYKGSSSDPGIFRFIFGSWLANSAYALDDRAYFEVLGDKYKNNDTNSEEEIWIPIKPLLSPQSPRTPRR